MENKNFSYADLLEPKNDEDYTAKRLKKDPDPEKVDAITQAYNRLETPLGQGEFKAEGRLTLQNPPFQLTVDYQSADSAQAKFQKLQSLYPEIFNDIKDWRLLNDLELTRSDRPNDALKVQDLRLEDVDILFYAGESPLEDSDGGYEPGLNIIFLPIKPITPRAIIDLVHEIGHAHDDQSLDTMNKRAAYYGDRNGANSITLKRERNAEAYTLKHVRQLTDTKPTGQFSILRNDLLNIIYLNLWEYSQEIKGEMETDE